MSSVPPVPACRSCGHPIAAHIAVNGGRCTVRAAGGACGCAKATR